MNQPDPAILANLLNAAFRNNLTMLLTDSNGINKTNLVLQAAEKIGAQVFIHKCQVANSLSFGALTFEVEGKFLHCQSKAASILTKAPNPTICFFEGISDSTLTVQAEIAKILKTREIEGFRVSDHVIFVGEFNKVSGGPCPLFSRSWNLIFDISTLSQNHPK